MKVIRKLLGVMLVVCVLLSGCGSSPASNETSPAASDKASPAASDKASPAAKKRDTLNLSLTMPLQSLDPNAPRTYQDLLFYSQIYECLVHINFNVEGLLEPRLAESYSFSEDGKTLTFKLRKDVKFHNGDPMKASDVVFSIKRAINGPNAGGGLKTVVDVVATDDYTVEIRSSSPNVAILNDLTFVYILSEREVTGLGDQFGSVVSKAGTGPYVITYLDNDVEWKCEAFPDYYRGEAPIKYLNYKPIVDTSTALIALEAGELDWLNAPIANYESLKNNPAFKTELIPANHIIWVCINWEASDVLRNDNVRKAIAYAINKDELNEAAFDGLAKVATHYENPDYNVAAPRGGLTYSYDPDKAKQLLAEAGYPNGVNVGKILTFPGNFYEKVAVTLQAQLEAVGIHSEMEFNEQSTVLARGRSQDYEVLVLGTGQTGDYSGTMFEHVHSSMKGAYIVKFEGNKFDYKNFDSLLERGLAETDSEKRVTIYQEFHDKIMDTACKIPLLHRVNLFAWNKDLNVVNVPDYYEVYDWSWN